MSSFLSRILRCSPTTFVVLVMLGLTCVMSPCARGLVLCIRADGTREVETAIEKEECCASANATELRKDSPGPVVSEDCCTDLPMADHDSCTITSPVVMKVLPAPVFACVPSTICPTAFAGGNPFTACLTFFPPPTPQREPLRSIILNL